jgi:serine/threonine-protein kinase
MHATSSDRPITRTGAVIGTVLYMAPEQMVDAKRVDARADLWSIGVMLFEMLTRQTPFGPINAPTLVTTMLTKPPAPLTMFRPDVPRPLEAVILRALEKTPERRWNNAAELGAALAPFASPRAQRYVEALRRTAPPSGAAAPRPPAPSPRASVPPRGPTTTQQDLAKRGGQEVRREAAPPNAQQIGVLVLIGIGAAALVFAIVAGVMLVKNRAASPPPDLRDDPAAR